MWSESDALSLSIIGLKRPRIFPKHASLVLCSLFKECILPSIVPLLRTDRVPSSYPYSVQIGHPHCCLTPNTPYRQGTLIVPLLHTDRVSLSYLYEWFSIPIIFWGCCEFMYVLTPYYCWSVATYLCIT